MGPPASEWAPAAKGVMVTLLPLSWGAPRQRAAALGAQKGHQEGTAAHVSVSGQQRSSQVAEDAARVSGSMGDTGPRTLPAAAPRALLPARRSSQGAAACESPRRGELLGGSCM